MYNFDNRLIELVDIDDIEYMHHVNGVDIEVEDDNTFTLASGILSHNSAAKPLIGVRNPQNMGVFALKGKPLNVENIPPKKLLENEEIKNLLTIIGLQLGEPVKFKSQLRFGKIVFATDADVDGKHIQGLLINLFAKFWPELLTTHQMIYNFRTPIIKVTTNKEVIDFYDEQSYNVWKKKNGSKKFSVNYYKGLGTSTTKEFREYINNINNHLVKYTIDDEEDKDSIKMAFSKDGAKSANDRKDWLDLI